MCRRGGTLQQGLLSHAQYCVQAIEIVPGRYYVCFLKRADSPTYSVIANTNISYCIDNELVRWSAVVIREALAPFEHVSPPLAYLQLYEPFYADFGPLNLGKTYRFCEHTRQLLQVSASSCWDLW